ncbi:hypothetical protein MIR68_011749 [Amoeboaphelidium protococcarum]|nr:hypothetical protein MIR68_011749 [Amoeboaphelidium protococcarum]
MQKSRSVAGISLKTQILYTVVYTTRYLDLFVHFISLYNTLMKMIFITSSSYILYLMTRKYRATYDPQYDTFRIEFLLVPSTLLALLFHYNWSPLEILWTFSIFLESVSVVPQLFLLTRTGEAETITTHYLFALGAYRGLYILNWIWRLSTENHYSDWISWIAGVVQTALYADFFYLYFTKVLRGKRFELPA